MITQSNMSIFETNKYRYKSCLGTALQVPESFLTIVGNQRVRQPNPIGIKFDSSGLISRVIMEVRPHLDLATFAPSYGFLRPGLLSRGVSVCLCTIWYMKTQFMFVFTKSTIKHEPAEIIIKNV